MRHYYTLGHLQPSRDVLIEVLREADTGTIRVKTNPFKFVGGAYPEFDELLYTACPSSGRRHEELEAQ